MIYTVFWLKEKGKILQAKRTKMNKAHTKRISNSNARPTYANEQPLTLNNWSSTLITTLMSTPVRSIDENNELLTWSIFCVTSKSLMFSTWLKTKRSIGSFTRGWNILYVKIFPRKNGIGRFQATFSLLHRRPSSNHRFRR